MSVGRMQPKGATGRNKRRKNGFYYKVDPKKKQFGGVALWRFHMPPRTAGFEPAYPS